MGSQEEFGRALLWRRWRGWKIAPFDSSRQPAHRAQPVLQAGMGVRIVGLHQKSAPQPARFILGYRVGLHHLSKRDHDIGRRLFLTVRAGKNLRPKSLLKE